MIRTFVILAALVASNCLSAAEPPAVKLPAKEKFHIYVLAGQSNMAGRGDVAKEDKTPHPRVLVLKKDGTWAPAVDPLHYDKAHAGVGLGKTFAQVLADADESITVGLVPTACGGSPIASWQPGGIHDQTNSHPYDDALARTRRALEDGELHGILWHQGESDANPKLAEVYGEKLTELIARFRKELASPQVPFVIGQLGEFPHRPWSEGYRLVDAAQQEVAKSVPGVAFVSSKDLTHRGDNLHFDSASLREFGRRYAAAYLALAKP
jgi:hypothetical protein